jgi:uncharacterized protein
MTVPDRTLYYLEIVTNDAAAMRDLFAAVYGWRFEPPIAELGGAFVAVLPNGSRCGIRAPMRSSEHPIVRTYIRVDDVQAAAQRAEQSGATIALPATEIPGHGTIVIYLYGGVEHGMWQLP